MWPNAQETADLVTFTEEILNGKLHFLYSDNHGYSSSNFIVVLEHLFAYHLTKSKKNPSEISNKDIEVASSAENLETCISVFDPSDVFRYRKRPAVWNMKCVNEGTEHSFV